MVAGGGGALNAPKEKSRVGVDLMGSILARLVKRAKVRGRLLDSAVCTQLAAAGGVGIGEIVPPPLLAGRERLLGVVGANFDLMLLPVLVVLDGPVQVSPLLPLLVAFALPLEGRKLVIVPRLVVTFLVIFQPPRRATLEILPEASAAGGEETRNYHDNDQHAFTHDLSPCKGSKTKTASPHNTTQLKNGQEQT